MHRIPLSFLLILAMLSAVLHRAPAQTIAVDSSFDPGSGLSGGSFPLVYDISLQNDGKIIAVGLFTNYNGATRRNLVRTNPNGSLDTNYDPGATLTGGRLDVYACTVQPDGKLLVGGAFTNISGQAQAGIARFNPDGSVDGSLRPTGISGTGTYYIHKLLLQPDGKIVVGGIFSAVDDTPRNSIARLNPNGTLDRSFDPGSGIATSTASGVFALARQLDGKILVGGRFTNIAGIARNCLARLNTNGSVDLSFDTGSGLQRTSFPAVNSIQVQSDNKILVGGMFDTVNGIPRSSIARLNADGSLDTSFNPGSGVVKSGVSGSVDVMILLADGRVLIGGSFDSVNGVVRSALAQLLANGGVDPSFDPGTGVTAPSSPFLHALALQPDGKLVIGGHFSAFNGTDRNNVARLNTGTAPVEPLKLIGPRKIGSRFEVSVPTKAGRKYTLQYKEQFNAAAWTSLAPIDGDGTIKLLVDPNATSNSRFYRASEE